MFYSGIQYVCRAGSLIIKKSVLLSVQGCNTGAHLTRYKMYKHLASVFANIEKKENSRTLIISGSQALYDLLKIKGERIIADFPEFNILNLSFPDNYFDYVVSDQVMEHVEGDQQRAIDEVYRVLKPGGIALNTTCFLNEIHEMPKDLWRFTPYALTYLHRKFSKILDVGGWGNGYALFLVLNGLRFCPVPHASWHPVHKIATHNDKSKPMVTWIVVVK